jgi:FtsH-binding integral membrane protein
MDRMAWIARDNERVNVGGGFGRVDASANAGRLSADAANTFLGRVFRTMALGLAVTGVVAMFVASSPAAMQFLVMNRGVMMALIIAQLVTVFAFTGLLSRVSAGTAAAMFFGYAALSGVTFSTIFLVYTSASIAGTFFITAGAFAGLSAYGYVTKRSLDGLGSFLFMGLIGLVLASIVNIFLGSSTVYWLTTFMGVIVFTGLAAYDTAKLKQLAATTDVSGEHGRKLALQGALMLYLDFINLFLMLLRLFGGRRRD